MLIAEIPLLRINGPACRLHVGPVRLGGLALDEHCSGCFFRMYTAVVDTVATTRDIVSITRESAYYTGTVAPAPASQC